MVRPIWKDYYVDFGQLEYADFEIRLIDGTVIYSGRSYPRPKDMSLKVKINDICADYLESLNKSEINTEEGFVSNDVAMEFRIFDDHETLLETVTFVNDWSYDYDRDSLSVLSDPINGVFDVRMPLMYSIAEGQTIKIKADGANADFSLDFSSDFKIVYDKVREVVAEGAGTLTLKNIFSKEGVIIVGELEYKGLTSCHTHALYYVNAYGGWDFLLLQGSVVETDRYTRHTSRAEYDNSNVKSRGEKNFLNEIEKTYVAHTGWLYRDQSKRMYHLLGSTEVYLFDLLTQKMIPVTLTNSECKYKTFKTEGNSLVDYELNLKLAKQMVRR